MLRAVRRSGGQCPPYVSRTVIALEMASYAPSLELAFRIEHAFDVGMWEVFQRVGRALPAGTCCAR